YRARVSCATGSGRGGERYESEKIFGSRPITGAVLCGFARARCRCIESVAQTLRRATRRARFRLSFSTGRIKTGPAHPIDETFRQRKSVSPFRNRPRISWVRKSLRNSGTQESDFVPAFLLSLAIRSFELQFVPDRPQIVEDRLEQRLFQKRHAR